MPPASARLAETNIKPIGNGPWKFEELAKDKQGNIHTYTLIPNSNYRGEQPYIDKIIFHFYPDFPTAIAALNQNNIIGLSYLPNNLNDSISEPPNFNYHDLNLPQYTALFFNSKNNSSLRNKNLRTALTHAINKRELIEIALQNRAQSINSPVLPNSPAFLSDLSTFTYDPEAAKTIIEEDEWELNKSGIYEKDDEELRISITTVNQEENLRVSQLIKDYWSNIGIVVDIVTVDTTNVQTEVIKDRDFEILLYGQIIGADPDPFPFWHSSQALHPGLNIAQFKNTNADKILEDARESIDEDVRIAQYQEFQRLIQKEVPSIFLYTPSYVYLHDKRVRGFDIDNLIIPADRFNNLHEWFINTKKRFK